MPDGCFYHVAPRSAREDIARYGLDVDAVVQRNHPWCDRGIYLWDELTAARAWKATHRGYTDPADIWRIHPDGIDPDDLLPDGYVRERPDLRIYEHSWFTVEPVDAQHLDLTA